MKYEYWEYQLKILGIIVMIGEGILGAGLCICLYILGYYHLLIVASIIIVFSYITIAVYIRNKAKKLNVILQLYLDGCITDEFLVEDIHLSKKFEEVFGRLINTVEKEKKIYAMSDNIHYLALQEQVNPHFLYNTLEGIRGTALVAGLHDLADMVENLAVFFRYTISQQKKLVSLEDEVLNAEHYFNIQKFRFKERVNLKILYDENEYAGMLSYRVPKLILQPFIENSIVHGFENKLEPGYITIAIEQTGDKLLIRISDNGTGIEESKVKRINAQLGNLPFEKNEDEVENSSRKNGIAIVNVNTRIKLLFGENYGVRVSSIKNYGSDIYIELPISERRDFEIDEE